MTSESRGNILSDIYQRKRDHIQLSHDGPVGLEGDRGLWSEVTLVHNALPELAMSEVDLSAQLLGHPLKAPLMITGMTGGPPEAGEINRSLARVCASLGVAFGVGSQRVITKNPQSRESFEVKSVAPDLILLANIGVNQLRDLGVDRVLELVHSIDADGLAIHLNPAMELIQPGADADSDFRRGYESIARIADVLQGKVLVKECGCGLSPGVVQRLSTLGVGAVDVSGVGGTSWVKVEALRAEGAEASLGHLLSDWGIPTAAAVALAAPHPIQVIASGGVYNPLIAVKALALGSDLVGCARPALQALLNEGEEGAHRFLSSFIDGMRVITALTGARRPIELRDRPKVLGPQLLSWLDQCPPRD